MTRIILDERVIRYSVLFESLTGSRLRGCFVDSEIIIFVVEPGELFKAIGRNGIFVRRMEQLLKSHIKIVEYAGSIEVFIQNLLYPAKVREILIENNVYTVVPLDLHSRGLMIGRNAQNLRNYERIVKRYFKIDGLRVR